MAKRENVFAKAEAATHCYVAKHNLCGGIFASHLDMKDKRTGDFVAGLIREGHNVERVPRPSVTVEKWCKCYG